MDGCSDPLEEGHPWADGPLSVSFIPTWDDESILQAKEIKLSHVTTTWEAIVREERTLVDLMEALVRYGKAISLQYKVPFLNARPRILLKTRCVLDSFQRKDARHAFHMCDLRNVFIEEWAAVPSGCEAERRRGTGKNLGILHLDSHVLYGSE